MFDDDVSVPAGWYPDPMGLPQLRWWNNHAWTELTTEARPPLVMQQQQQSAPSTRVLYADDELRADDELPTRRQQREQREREDEYARLATDAGDERDAAAANSPLTTTLREIDPPVVLAGSSTTAHSHKAFDDAVMTTATVPDRAGHSDRSGVDEGDIGVAESFDDVFQPRSATSAVSAPTAQGERARTAEPENTRSTAFPRLPVSTGPVWIIALLPLLQLVFGLMVLVGLTSIIGTGFTVATFAGPYIIVVVLAIADRAMLKRAGHENPAHWAWAFLTAPVYLIARSAALIRTGNVGLGPLLVWVALGILQVGSILVVPGMLISVFPTVFSAQASQSVSLASKSVGAQLAVECPTPTPLIVGSQFYCAATSPAGGHYQVTVKLERANGWIDWRVDSWGDYLLYRR
ncbi:MAG: hypothetical protein JWN80_875 [Microbacteriaceae bacterium]|nr:hypothetical protein [Microbacteriaceae bacterium]